MEPNTSCLSCNLCSCKVDGIAYKTACRHIFCNFCAKKSFENDSFCPTCRSNLTSGEVTEVNIGIASVPLAETLFQNALQNTSWDKIVDNLNRISSTVTEVSQFVAEQLYLQSQQYKREKDKSVNELNTLNSHMARLNDRIVDMEVQQGNAFKQYESQINTKNKELLELQDAYKEKLRKCQAWEKAYNNVRSQLTDKSGSSNGGGVLLPDNITISHTNNNGENRYLTSSASTIVPFSGSSNHHHHQPQQHQHQQMYQTMPGTVVSGMGHINSMLVPVARAVRQSTEYITSERGPDGRAVQYTTTLPSQYFREPLLHPQRGLPTSYTMPPPPTVTAVMPGTAQTSMTAVSSRYLNMNRPEPSQQMVAHSDPPQGYGQGQMMVVPAQYQQYQIPPLQGQIHQQQPQFQTRKVNYAQSSEGGLSDQQSRGNGKRVKSSFFDK